MQAQRQASRQQCQPRHALLCPATSDADIMLLLGTVLPLVGPDSALAVDPTTVFDLRPYPGRPGRRRRGPPQAWGCGGWPTRSPRDLPARTSAVMAAPQRPPIEATANRLPPLIKDMRLVTVPGGRHNIGWTHPDEVDKALLDFLSE
jgi:pimeloyl-ACP methyl ester carboxylesterase